MAQVNKTPNLGFTKNFIENFDFGYVVDKAIKDGMPPQVSAQALTEFKEFLFAHAAHPSLPLVPQSCWCDDLWHQFIVADTRAYFRFCEVAFGHYLHHDGVNATASEQTLRRAQSARVLTKTVISYGGKDLPVECGMAAVECGIAVVECGIAIDKALPSVQPRADRSDRVAH
ncbi:hypothetical protein SAE02_67990 [Skermanella aerolata]|uniref:Uncharacterized protein n=1 Tax=Skermanella aerolata TaxID=393310 RepID=A0A512E1Q0_9PROT|nr:hypothetical protein [Skermanella aerolata]KJB91192.1 hypothetical protein N826_31725 [Skermanella aerolata KACC 11604]GEO42651.1 hypothetical protein SAE02_67990 [Skermanella aerolata]